MIETLKRRQERNKAKDILRHLRAIRQMREDLLSSETIAALMQNEDALEQAIRDRKYEELEALSSVAQKDLERLVPERRQSGGLGENLEVLVVAFAVAMCFRAYALQPFKIPTGSMQPTLNGIRYEQIEDKPHITHRMPFAPLRFVLLGDWYVVKRAKTSGRVTSISNDHGTGKRRVVIGNLAHLMSANLPLEIAEGEIIKRGEIIARGIRQSGDHLFVNKVVWNFRQPKRGEIIVFKTDNIPALHHKKTHYIKRLVGLPGERVSIRPPDLYINGKPVTEPRSIVNIQTRSGEHDLGYVIPMTDAVRPALYANGVEYGLGLEHYFACGDNTDNSFDSRYWGAVPGANLVGPATWVYRPFGRHFGLIRR